MATAALLVQDDLVIMVENDGMYTHAPRICITR